MDRKRELFGGSNPEDWERAERGEICALEGFSRHAMILSIHMLSYVSILEGIKRAVPCYECMGALFVRANTDAVIYLYGHERGMPWQNPLAYAISYLSQAYWS